MTKASKTRLERRAKGKRPRLLQRELPARTPPYGVRAILRREVGFGCPVPGCGSPWLSYHHFDPPWRVEHHHRPEGMIALCNTHHPEADGGAFTKDQLRQFKRDALANAQEVRARFNWLRTELLVVCGGTVFKRFLRIVSFMDIPIIWLNREPNSGNLLLNIRMPTNSGDPRLWVSDNDFLLLGAPVDLICPSQGRLIDVRYSNGDALRVEFLEIDSASDLEKRLRSHDLSNWNFEYPITLCEISLTIGGSANIKLRPQQLAIGNSQAIKGPVLLLGNDEVGALNIRV